MSRYRSRIIVSNLPAAFVAVCTRRWPLDWINPCCTVYAVHPRQRSVTSAMTVATEIIHLVGWLLIHRGNRSVVIEMRDCVLTGAGGTLAGSGVAALCGWLSIQVKRCDFERCSLYGCVHHKARKRQRKKSDYLCGSQIAIFDSTQHETREESLAARRERGVSGEPWRNLRSRK